MTDYQKSQTLDLRRGPGVRESDLDVVPIRIHRQPNLIEPTPQILTSKQSTNSPKYEEVPEKARG